MPYHIPATPTKASRWRTADTSMVLCTERCRRSGVGGSGSKTTRLSKDGSAKYAKKTEAWQGFALETTTTVNHYIIGLEVYRLIGRDLWAKTLNLC